MTDRRRGGTDGSLGARPDEARSKETLFRLAASSAKDVLLAADFTGWKRSPLKMIKGADGVWRLTVRLAPGRYRYQFLIDLGSQNMVSARGPMPFGTLHGVVEVNDSRAA